jgi:hypothetical protein
MCGESEVLNRTAVDDPCPASTEGTRASGADAHASALRAGLPPVLHDFDESVISGGLMAYPGRCASLSLGLQGRLARFGRHDIFA